MRVLIVEDEESIQGILSTFITKYAMEKGDKAEIRALGDPVQALFELTSSGGGYDAVLMDVRMPKLTGDEIYNSLLHVTPEILNRVLFVTGYRQDLEERFPDRKLNILDKPFRYPQLAGMLDAITGA